MLALLANPMVLVGGAVLGLIMIAGRGTGGGNNAAVTLESQKIATSANVKLAEIQAQRDAAIGATKAQVAIARGEQGTAQKALAIGYLVDGNRHTEALIQNATNQNIATMQNNLAKFAYQRTFDIQSKGLDYQLQLGKETLSNHRYQIDAETGLAKTALDYNSSLGMAGINLQERALQYGFTAQLNQSQLDSDLKHASLPLISKQMDLQNAQHILNSERHYQQMVMQDHQFYRTAEMQANRDWYNYDIPASQIDAGKGGIGGLLGGIGKGISALSDGIGKTFSLFA